MNVFIAVFHLLLRLNLHSFEYVPTFQHNIVSFFDCVLRVIISVVRHSKKQVNRSSRQLKASCHLRLIRPARLWQGTFTKGTKPPWIQRKNTAKRYSHVLAFVSLASQDDYTIADCLFHRRHLWLAGGASLSFTANENEVRCQRWQRCQNVDFRVIDKRGFRVIPA